MWILFLLIASEADQITHKYLEGDEVILWFNKVLPFNNPQESYAYSKLPLCSGAKNDKKYIISLGEAIEGYELEDSGIDIKFLQPVTGQVFCNLIVNEQNKAEIIEAVQRNYWLQMFIDDLPIWSGIGEYDGESGNSYIYTHYCFFISYNNNRIIIAKANFERLVNLKNIEKITFSYSVN